MHMLDPRATAWQGPMNTIPPSYFIGRYAARSDPWELSNSQYEVRKRQHVLEMLPRSHYHRGYEPGCARGDLTRLLAPRVAELWAVETVSKAITITNKTCASYSNVRTIRADIRYWTPPGPIDLVVFSEILYYFSASDFHRIISQIGAQLSNDANVIAVHRCRRPGAGWNATQLHKVLTLTLGGTITAQSQNQDYEIAVLSANHGGWVP